MRFFVGLTDIVAFRQAVGDCDRRQWYLLAGQSYAIKCCEVTHAQYEGLNRKSQPTSTEHQAFDANVSNFLHTHQNSPSSLANECS